MQSNRKIDSNQPAAAPLTYLFATPPTPSAPTFSTNDYLDQAIALQKQIEKLNWEMNHNQLLQDQYQLLKQGKIIFDSTSANPNTNFLATAEFIEMIQQYEKAFQQYQQLKQETIAAKLIDPFEIAAIEESVQQQIEREFFPLQQKIFDDAKADIEKEKKSIIQSEENKIQQLQQRYEEKSKGYAELHGTFIVLSVFGVGLPFLITSLICHLKFKHHTKKQIQRSESAIKQASDNADQKIGNVYSILHNSIKSGHPLTQFRQGFFQLARAVEKHEVPQLSAKKFN